MMPLEHLFPSPLSPTRRQRAAWEQCQKRLSQMGSLSSSAPLLRSWEELTHGRPFVAQSSAYGPLAPSEALVLSLSEAKTSYGPLLHRSFSRSLAEETNPFALLNGALSYDGLFIYLPPSAQASLSLLPPCPEPESYLSPRLFVFLGAGARLHLTSYVEGRGRYFYNQYMEVSLAPGSHCTLETHSSHGEEGYAMDTFRAFVKADAHLQVSTLSRGAHCERADLHVEMVEAGGSASLRGLGISKEQFHVQSGVRHRAPSCTSQQHYRALLYGRGRSTLHGKILVERAAQRTDAYQRSHILLLSPQASGQSCPNLQIYADDVKASHGATCAPLREEELFYLRSRGVTDAISYLLRSFCREASEAPAIDGLLAEAIR